MIIFDPKTKEQFFNWRGYKRRPFGDDRSRYNEDDIAFMAMLVTRIAEGYSCSTAEGFSYEEAEIADLLQEVYEAGYKHACDRIKERVVPQLNGIIGY